MLPEVYFLKNKVGLRQLFIFVLAVAIALIAIGGYNVWKAFQRFDTNILSEKDSQFYSLIRSDDINIENSINSFIREAETFLAREGLAREVRVWKDSKDKSGVRTYLKENSLKNNPIYADILMKNNDKIVVSESGSDDYVFVTGRDASGLRLVKKNDGNYYMAYEQEGKGGVVYDVLIDLKALYSSAIVSNAEHSVMLIDSSKNIIISSADNTVSIVSLIAPPDDNDSECRDYLLSCEERDISDGMSMDLTDESGKDYTARMVVMPSGSTVNGEFGIGIIADYEEALAPSRAAAKRILIFGGMAILGALALLLIIFYMRRANYASSEELRMLKKKNEAMEEINQKMQALTHHQRLETIGTMTASIAHDFNNLLTPIMGYSIMTMEMLPPDATDLQDNLLEVYNASVKAKDIVSRLAELTKKGSEESYEDIEIDEVIQSALKVTLPAKPKNVEVKANFDAEGVLVKADSTQISQLVMNIVLNAYDAMREEGGTIMVSSRQSGEEILLRFKDTGCGMDAETVSRIFDPFYTTKESGKGTGLGLAIVAQIVETHGGRIYVESEKGSGTEFRIYIPKSGSGIDGLSFGAGPESKYDTKRYSAKIFRQELARAEAEKRKLEESDKDDKKSDFDGE